MGTPKKYIATGIYQTPVCYVYTHAMGNDDAPSPAILKQAIQKVGNRLCWGDKIAVFPDGHVGVYDPQTFSEHFKIAD